MSNNLGTLTLDLVAQMGGWVNGFTQAERATKSETRKMQRSIKEVENSVKSMGNTMRSVAGLIGLTLTVSAFDGWIRGSVQAAANAGVFAEKIGLTTEELTTFRYIAVQTGSDIQSLDSSMLRLNSRLGAAASGGGPAAATLKRLGLNAKELLSLPLEERILAISKAMEGLSRGEQLRSLQNIAGDSARGLINIFQLSQKEISELTNRAQRLGYVYSSEMSKSADAVLTKVNEMKGAFGNLSLQIISEFLPDIENYLNSISLEDLEKHMETARTVVDNLGIAIKALAIAFGITLTGKIVGNTLALSVGTIAKIRDIAATQQLAGESLMAANAIGVKTVAVNGLRIALGALGGPLGIAILTSLSFLALSSSQDKTKRSSDDLLASIDELSAGIDKLSLSQARHNEDLLTEDLSLIEVRIDELKGAQELLQQKKSDLQEEISRYGGILVRNELGLGFDVDTNKAQIELDRLRKEENRLDAQQYALNKKFEEGKISLENYKEQIKLLTDESYALSVSNEEVEKNLGKMLNKIQVDTERMGLKTKVEIFNHEWNKTTQWDEYKVGDDQEQERVKAQIAAAFAEQDAKEKTLRISTKSIDIAAEYRKVMEGTLSDEERRGHELAKNLDILKQYGASEEDMLAVRRAAYDSMSIEMPDMGEGGNTLTAQLARLGENMAQLDAWREEQLIKLELAYGNEESALAESLEKREELERQYRERRSQFEGEMNQELLNLSLSMTSDSLSALREAGMESTAIGKAVFFMNRGISASNTIVSALAAGTKATETLPGMPGVALGKAITAMGMVNAGLIMGTGLKGMAHSGLDKVPETGTWLLEKGERVVTSNTSAKLDATLENLRNQNAGNSSGDVYSSINVTINKDGETESESEVGGIAFANLVKGLVVDIISREMKSGGTLAKR